MLYFWCNTVPGQYHKTTALSDYKHNCLNSQMHSLKGGGQLQDYLPLFLLQHHQTTKKDSMFHNLLIHNIWMNSFETRQSSLLFFCELCTNIKFQYFSVIHAGTVSVSVNHKAFVQWHGNVGEGVYITNRIWVSACLSHVPGGCIQRKFSKPLNLLLSILVWWYIILSQNVMWKDCVAVLNVKVTFTDLVFIYYKGEKKLVSASPDRSYFFLSDPKLFDPLPPPPPKKSIWADDTRGIGQTKTATKKQNKKREKK